jgi:general secretion pathway protein A
MLAGRAEPSATVLQGLSMYESFYGLKIKPFAVVPDPRFIYWAGPHSMAFAMLEYGIVNHAGFTVVTGEIGSGKTTLLRHLLGQLPGDISIGLVSNMQGDRGDLLEWVLMAFGQDFEGASYVALYQKFTRFLVDQYEQGRRTVLVIDEAQNLGAKALEELRMLYNVNSHDRELLQIVLSGQPELKTLLSRPELTQFAQRVSSDFHLGLLDSTEVPAYIDHRLAIAGADRLLFTDDAIALIAYATRGTPRLINILCDTALMYGFGTGASVVDGAIVQRVLEDKRRFGIFPLDASARANPVG